MAYIKDFNKYRYNRIGRIQGIEIMRKMKDRDRHLIEREIKGLGTKRKSLYNVVKDIESEYGRIPSRRFQQAVIDKNKKPGLTEQQKKVNISLWQQQRLAEEEDAYQTYAGELKKDREEKKAGITEKKKGGIITPELESAVAVNKRPLTGFASGKEATDSSFAKTKPGEASSSPVKPVENAIGITGPTRK